MNSKNEKEKILYLKTLCGVGVPTASALLTLIDQKKYGIIDIRVWQTLHHLHLVDNNKRGTSLTVNNWLKFLEIIRSLAKTYKTSPRKIEQTLFRYHKDRLQRGNLYN